MALENIKSLTDSSVTTNSSSTQFNCMLVNKAESLGIDVEKYYNYDAEGNCTGVNLQQLSIAINEAQTAATSDDTESDTFVKSDENTTGQDEEDSTEANSAKNTINSDYTDAILKYSKSVENFENNASKEGQLASEWNNIETEASKLTSVLASDTTILEGVKEFITNLANLVNNTKSYEKSKEYAEKEETALSLETARDIIDEQNSIMIYETETYDNTLGNNPFFSSVFETIEYDEAAAV